MTHCDRSLMHSDIYATDDKSWIGTRTRCYVRRYEYDRWSELSEGCGICH